MDSLLRWVGGKRLLRKKIVELIPNRKVYVEPFGGAAWVLFYKERLPKEIEVYNDINSNLTNLFLQIKYHSDAVINELRLMLKSRKMFQMMKDWNGLTEIQKAARFYYLVLISFGGFGQHFGRSIKTGGGSISLYV